MTNQEKAYKILEESCAGNFVVVTGSEYSVLKYIAAGNDQSDYYLAILDSNWN
jgi:hypothetical protein